MGNPSNTGLKNQWGVGNPGGGNPAPSDAGGGGQQTQPQGSDQQANEFKAAFEAEQGKINEHLQYTSANAEASKHSGYASRRDALYGKFQGALGAIDRNDPSKAQGAIDAVLGEARSLCAEVTTFRQETEAAKSEWDSKQASFDEAVHHVEELESWEDAQAGTLRGQAESIRGHTNERRWREACSALDGLLPSLQPVYEEYSKQKEAKPQYEQRLAEHTAKLESLKAVDRPSQPMTAKAGEADAALQEAKGKADAKDFVGGVQGMEQVQAKADELDRLANDPARQQYLADSQGLEQQSTPQPEPAFQSLDADWAAISEAQAQAQPKADAGDYAGANQSLADSKGKREEFQRKHDELVQQKQEYETLLAQLQPRIQAVSMSDPQYAKLEPMVQELSGVQTQMEAAAQADDYAQALTLATDLSTRLDTIEQAKQEIDAKKQEYETALATLQPRIQAISQSDPAYSRIEPQLQEITQAQTTMEASAQAGDYDQAMTQLQDLTTQVDSYERAKSEIDQKKQEYETALAALQPRIQAISQSDPAYSKIEPLLQEITAAQGAMEASAQAGDYDQAMMQLQDLTTQVDSYEKAKSEIDQKKQEYEAAAAEVEALMQKVDGCKLTSMEPKKAALVASRDAMTQQAAQGDFDAALASVQKLKGEAEAFEQEAETARTAIRSAIDAKLPPIETELAGMKDTKSNMKGQVDKLVQSIRAAKSGNDDAALQQAQKDLDNLPRLMSELKQVEDVKNKMGAAGTEAEKKAAAQKIIDELDKKGELAKMPTEARNILIEEMMKGAVTAKDTDAINKIWANPSIDENFDKLDKPVRDRIIKSYAEDPKVLEYRKNWSTMTPDEKKEAIKYLTTIPAGQEGWNVGVPEIDTYNLSDAERQALKDKGEYSPPKYGKYSAKNDKIEVNAHDDAHARFDELLDTVAHEVGHKEQARLIKGYRDGSLPATDPSYEQAKALALCEDYRKQHNSEFKKVYSTSPEEAHSRAMGSELQNEMAKRFPPTPAPGPAPAPSPSGTPAPGTSPKDSGDDHDHDR
ncbi:MAG: hypothetical protein JNN18_18755 [Rubrivivax sp.]|nr:hypothetical protein [Rubrivivax sp.]